MCRNIDKNTQNGEETAQLFGFFRDLAKWTGMAIFYSNLMKKLREQRTIVA